MRLHAERPAQSSKRHLLDLGISSSGGPWAQGFVYLEKGLPFWYWVTV